MAQDNRKTEKDREQSSRFEHKSQGVRTQSQMTKLAREKVVDEKAVAAEEELKKTISAKLERTFREEEEAERRQAEAEAEREKEREKQRAQKVVRKTELVEEQPVKKAVSRPEEPVKTAKPSAPRTSSSLKFDEAMKLAETEDTVVIRESDIPAYEIGLGTREAYTPKEIRTGKVVKISEDQFGNITAQGPRKKKTAKEVRREEKEQITPHQKLVRRIVWSSIWLAVLIIGFIGFRICYGIFYDVAVDPDSTTTYEYTVAAGATDASVYDDLTELGVIDCSEFIYKLRAIVFDAEYIEGTYELSDGFTTEKIINILAGYDYSD